MKNKLLVLMMLCLGICANSSLYAKENGIQVAVNSEKIIFTDQTGYPYIDENGRMQVPFRIILSSIGANVTWENNSAVATKKGTRVEVPLNAYYIFKNGEKIEMDTCAKNINNKIYLPIRAVMEAFGYEVTMKNQLLAINEKQLIEGYDTEKLRYNADYEVQVGNDIYWVPARVLGGSKYTNEQIKEMLALTPEEKQDKISTLYEALQLYELGNFAQADDNIRIRESEMNWEHHKPGYYAVSTNEGCCATSSNWLNYILKDDYEEVGFVAYSQANGNGHILNYIKDKGYYYVIDLTHYRTDFFEGAGIETGDLADYYKRDSIGDNIHKVTKLEDYVAHCVKRFNDPPELFFTYMAEDCLPIDGIRKSSGVTIVYPNTIELKVLYHNQEAKITYEFVEPPKKMPDWSKVK